MQKKIAAAATCGILSPPGRQNGIPSLIAVAVARRNPGTGARDSSPMKSQVERYVMVAYYQVAGAIRAVPGPSRSGNIFDRNKNEVW
jgi:hypothetical protein